MTEASVLERRYRRLLALYPRASRREHEDEMLGVLVACAGSERRRPGPAESADLIANALRMRLRPGVPRSAPTVFVAVRLMYLGAALELVTLLTVLLTLGSVRSAILRADPTFTAAQWHALVAARIVPAEIGAPVVAGVWVWLAWANGRGHRWARAAFAALFAFTSLSLIVDLAQAVPTFAPADMIAAGMLWLVALATLVLVFAGRSDAHYERQPAERWTLDCAGE